MKFEFERAKIWTDIDSIEDSALKQIKAAMNHPRLFKHLAIMPDVHTGIGCTIGTVMALKDAIIPASVGVDIGCGMCALKTDLTSEDIDSQVDTIHELIVSAIPRGFAHRDKQQTIVAKEFLSSEMKDEILFYERKYDKKAIIPQLGTLGGGNHFIELQTDNHNQVWIMIHSGSRNIGNKIALTYIDLAKQMKHQISQGEDVPDDMEYLPVTSPEGIDYQNEMAFALNFALQNRFLMMDCIQKILSNIFPTTNYDSIINIHHNYAALESHFDQDVWVHRKGATKATPSTLGIIPGSMGTSSYIVQGKGNQDSFTSCSHGAGRIMSRTAARGKYHRRKKKYISEGLLSLDDFKKDMANIYSHSLDREHLDEAPRAYKPIQQVMSNQTDLIDIVTELKPIMNIKG